jgi:hypothetical protein
LPYSSILKMEVIRLSKLLRSPKYEALQSTWFLFRCNCSLVLLAEVPKERHSHSFVQVRTSLFLVVSVHPVPDSSLVTSYYMLAQI